MINKELREYLAETCENAILFDNPSFDNSIVGIEHSCDRVVYSYDMMIKELSQEDNITEEEAMEFIDYNTIRALPYVDSSTSPIIIYDLFIKDFKN